MNIIILESDDFIDIPHRAILSGRRFTHIMKIMNAKVGDSLKVGILNGKMGEGRILSINDTQLEMEIQLKSDPPAPLAAILILALPRPKMMNRVLFNAASMGVKKIFIINSYHVEKSFWDSAYLENEKIEKQLLLALEQSQDTMMPKVIKKRFFKPFVEDELPTIIKNTLPLVAHPAAEKPCPRDTKEHVTLAIGPESGFIPYEIDALIQCGFTPVTIGERILRVETAVPAILSHIF